MRVILFLFWLLFSLSAYCQSIVYVTPAGAGNRSGSSWADASSNLQLAYNLAKASDGTQFWLAAGTYKPTPTTDKSVSFTITQGVQLYGGFSGNESSLEQRNPTANETIISGDIGVENYREDNTYRLLFIKNAGSSVVLDGLTFSDANKTNNNGSYMGNASVWGGGAIAIYSDTQECSPTITNCRFLRNRAIIEPNFIVIDYQDGGAILVIASDGGKCKALIQRCYFYDNHATAGGAMAMLSFRDASVHTTITDCEFVGNLTYGSSGGSGGAIRCGGVIFPYTIPGRATTLIDRCKFFRNESNSGGAIASGGQSTLVVDRSIFSTNKSNFGGVFSLGGLNAISNCLFVSNSSNEGGLASSSGYQNSFINCTSYANVLNQTGTANTLFRGGSYRLTNCIISGEPTLYSLSAHGESVEARYSLIQGGYAGEGNLDTDPLFVNHTQENFRLQATSPAINSGDVSFSDTLTTDLSGQKRIQGGRIDIGAYEFTSVDCSSGLFTTKSGNWNDPAIWSCGRVPSSEDDVTIQSGHTIILNSAMRKATCRNLKILGKFSPTNGTLLIKGSQSR